jgi:hypothetical protein
MLLAFEEQFKGKNEKFRGSGELEKMKNYE